MGKLRDQMLMELQLRNYRPKTIDAYIWHMEQYTRLFMRSPASMGEPEIRQYLHHLIVKKGVSYSNVNVGYCALKFFYVNTLHRPWQVEKIPRPKGARKLPVVLSRSEIKRLVTVTDNLKHRAMLMVTYSGGLRVSETAHLKIPDIDSRRMVIRVDQGKGNKDRYTLLSKVAVNQLRRYYIQYRPKEWLFPGKDGECPINVSTIQRLFKKSLQKAGIRKPATVHTLRHSFATHTLEDGTDVFSLKELLGHSSLKTTFIYTHIQRKHITKLVSPLDHFMGEE